MESWCKFLLPCFKLLLADLSNWVILGILGTVWVHHITSIIYCYFYQWDGIFSAPKSSRVCFCPLFSFSLFIFWSSELWHCSSLHLIRVANPIRACEDHLLQLYFFVNLSLFKIDIDYVFRFTKRSVKYWFLPSGSVISSYTYACILIFIKLLLQQLVRDMLVYRSLSRAHWMNWSFGLVVDVNICC